jgi:hypothetical protein
MHNSEDYKKGLEWKNPLSVTRDKMAVWRHVTSSPHHLQWKHEGQILSDEWIRSEITEIERGSYLACYQAVDHEPNALDFLQIWPVVSRIVPGVHAVGMQHSSKRVDTWEFWPPRDIHSQLQRSHIVKNNITSRKYL